jgi:Cu-processing system ATP-binding protein
MDQVLNVRSVTKNFKSVRALDSVDMIVAPGESVALLGHNGAGKTTLFRLILGFIRPDAGSISIMRALPGSDAARQSISYLPENVAFPPALTGKEVLTLYARLKGVDPRTAMSALERVGLGDAARRQVRGYSKGMRQRLGLAQALIGAPRLLLLDEPTSGLDPLSRREFYDHFAEMAAAGTAVVFSSHGLGEVDGKTDRIVIMRAGRVVAEGPRARLQAEAGLPIRIRIVVAHDAADALAGRIGGRRVNGEKVEIICRPEEKLEKIKMASALADGVRDIEVHEPGLDEVFHYYSTRPEAAR